MDNISIVNKKDVFDLIKAVQTNEMLSHRFEFSTDELRNLFLEGLNISISEYKKKYYHFDKTINLHISESEHGYIWISTIGLVADRESLTFYNNHFVRSMTYQYVVVTLLIDKSLKLCKKNDIYDIDSYHFGELCKLTPTLFHNMIFFYELVGKSYLSLNNVEPKKTHNLENIYSEAKNTMFEQKQNDTLFNQLIFHQIEPMIKHLKAIPDNFKEQYVKYDDNKSDSTMITFDYESLESNKRLIDLCNDFLCEFCLEGLNSHYLKSGLLNRILEKASTKKDKDKVTNFYNYLINNK